MTGKPLTNRQLAKAGTRTRIISVAWQMFRAKGYDAVTIRDVAKAVGMSTGAVFCNFTDKADLFTACTCRPPPNVAGFLHEISCRASASAVDDLAARAAVLLADLIGEEGVRAFAAE